MMTPSGGPWIPLYAYGGTALYSLIAVRAAPHLNLRPTCTPLDPTSFHVEGRDNSAAAPEAQVVHITQGYSRDQRPALNQVMLELIVEQQAGIPLLMQPLSGKSRDPHAFGEVIRPHIEQWPTAYGATYMVADRALYSADNLGMLAQTALKWITRVPATLREAQVALAHADPQAMAALYGGDRSHELPSTYGGVPQRWVLLYSEPRQAPAQRTVDKQLRQQSDLAGKA